MQGDKSGGTGVDEEITWGCGLGAATVVTPRCLHEAQASH